MSARVKTIRPAIRKQDLRPLILTPYDREHIPGEKYII
jgi:hypothetical protein